MEEADTLLIQSLKQVNIKISKLEELDSPLFIRALTGCFESIADMLSKEDNFIDVRFLKSQDMKQQSDKFRVCQKLTQYMKTLDYYNELTFNMFLFPNVKDVRKILAFLFDIMFRNDIDDTEQSQPTNTQEVLVKRRLTKAKGKPWIMPEFLKGQKP